MATVEPTPQLPLFDRISTWIKDWQVLLVLLIGAFVTSRGSFGYIFVNEISRRQEWWEGFWQNFGTEIFGAFLTFFLIEMLVEARNRKEDQALQETIATRTEQQIQGFLEQQRQQQIEEEEEAEKERLILQMGSPNNAFAVEAVRQLTARGWLRDGSLDEVKLEGANLERATLQGASLDGANLEGANLEGADLLDAELEGASLYAAKLERATLEYAKLERASLLLANLWGANLAFANLERADLFGANLQGALILTVDQLRSAKTLLGATLPDGTQLPADDTWQDEFEHWVEHTAQFKEINRRSLRGTFIVPTRTEANAELWDWYYGDDE